LTELLAKLQNAWSNLAPREQILVGISGLMLAASIVVFGLITPLVELSNGSQQRVETAQRQLEAMSRLQLEHAEIQSRLTGVEERIQNQRGRQNIRTLLESLAKKSSVRIASMEERQAGKNDHYIETKVEVALKGVSLSQTVEYLHEIEAANQQLSVKGLRIKGRDASGDAQLLDVTFSVSSFEPV
jgi:type II secretory pathway component PulM